MIFVSNAIFAQKTSSQKENLLLRELAKTQAVRPFANNSLPGNPVQSKPFLSPQFYSSQLGFFCREEIKFDKITKIPFRFRLGSVDQCDRLEGKGKQ
jgi:hypothetical protein